MSKASQRRLAEQQKRVEKLKREDPHFKARVELLEMDPADVFANPVRYWTRLSNATEADAPHADHAFLDAAFEWKVEFFEVLHDALLYEQDRLYVGAEGPFLPGLTMGFDEDGWITSFLPQSPVFTPAPAKGTKWGAHLADLQSRTGQTLAGVAQLSTPGNGQAEQQQPYIRIRREQYHHDRSISVGAFALSL